MAVDRLLGIALLALVACAPEEGRGNSADDFGGPEPCTPGEQQACPCAGGLPDGVQVCNDAGDRFGKCMGCNEEEEDDEDSTTTSPEPDSSTSSSDDGPVTTMTTGMPPDVPPVDSDGIPDNAPAATPPAPPPDGYPIVEQVAAERPDLVAGSCVKTGGNNEFLYEVVRRLRMQDERWGLNWKRGNVGDLSQDVVDYHYGDGVSEESTDVYIIDVIGGHCGDAPSAAWIDVTQATIDAGTVGKWTLNGQDL